MATRHLLKLYRIEFKIAAPVLIGTQNVTLFGYSYNENGMTLLLHEHLKTWATKWGDDYEATDIDIKEVDYSEGLLL